MDGNTGCVLIIVVTGLLGLALFLNSPIPSTACVVGAVGLTLAAILAKPKE